MTRQRGFTLLELVVTLFVISVAMAITMPAIGRGMESLRVRAEVARFSSFLRHAREQAITKGEERTVSVDPAAGTVSDESHNEVRAQRPLPEGMTIKALPPSTLTVQFSPQGYSSGGAFRLSVGDRVAYRVTIDPLTGRVTNRRELSQ